MTTHKFWPWDYDPDGEIYENVAWDLPGFRRGSSSRPPRGQSDKPSTAKRTAR